MDASELIGVCDVDPEAAERVAKKHGVKAFANLDEMLNESGIEAIDVVTSGSHRDPVVKAAESGRHVMVEVPFAVTLGECDDMIEAAERAGVNLCTSTRSSQKETRTASPTTPLSTSRATAASTTSPCIYR